MQRWIQLSSFCAGGLPCAFSAAAVPTIGPKYVLRHRRRLVFNTASSFDAISTEFFSFTDFTFDRPGRCFGRQLLVIYRLVACMRRRSAAVELPSLASTAMLLLKCSI